MSEPRFPGYILTEAREERGLSLQDVHGRIHIPVLHLRALEAGDIEALPPETYAIGFLTSYCQFLGLDAERYADQYRLCCRKTTGFRRKRRGLQPAPVAQAQAQEASERPAWLAEVITWGAICALLLFGWLAYSVVTEPFTQDIKQRVDAGTLEVEPPTHFEEDF